MVDVYFIDYGSLCWELLVTPGTGVISGGDIGGSYAIGTITLSAYVHGLLHPDV